ncbi:MAG: hypothetical protein NC187_01465 [Candidatus Amulumruptor caecigallinarius]|nr:hypothetical protein [Candidatus Amulumruptor caecigallinarius]MCM1396143.1 hypothetical protein [Candidatus Amulumruptor caecigallinarius]MCM1453857.1 hypothetical protein [bacterium]
MKIRMAPLLMSLAAISVAAGSKPRHPVVADAVTRDPLSSASVFDSKGNPIGITRPDGSVICASAADYPLSIRYMGYHENTLESPGTDTLFLTENITRLPEVLVEAKQVKLLHILAYVREYSTLTTYADTVTMFREKMVDFMLPTDEKHSYRGWRLPRVLNARSYYRFTNATGLDSVSDRFGNHFSWSDWIGMFPTADLPTPLRAVEVATDTLRGKYSPVETWRRDGDRISVNVNVLADTIGRRWVPNISSFFRKDNTEFELFRMRLNYADVGPISVTPLELTGYSVNIESRGRGHNMFMFHHDDEPFFVSTYTEAYILDKEFVTVKTAKRWERCISDKGRDIDIIDPPEAPGLPSSTLALIERVNNLDPDKARLSVAPDTRLISRHVRKHNPNNLGFRALTMLKDLTGITDFKARRNFNRNWRKFIDGRKLSNSRRDSLRGFSLPDTLLSPDSLSSHPDSVTP